MHVFPSVEVGVCLGSPLLPHAQEALSQPTCPASWDAEAGEAPTAASGPAHGEKPLALVPSPLCLSPPTGQCGHLLSPGPRN